MSETGFRIFNQVFSAGAGLTYAALLTAFFRPFVPQDKRRRGLLLVFFVYILFEIVCNRAALPQGSFGLILMTILLVASKWIGLGKPSVFLLTLLYFNARISSGLMVQSLYFIVERSVPYRLEPPEAVFLRAALLVVLFLLSHASMLAVMLYALQRQMRKQKMTLHRRELCYLTLVPTAGILFGQVISRLQGYYTFASYADTFRLYGNSIEESWVSPGETTIKVDQKIMDWVNSSKEWLDAGYLDKNVKGQWNDDWNKAMSSASKVFAFLFPAWGIDFTLNPNWDGEDGVWAVTNPPQEYNWGGSYVHACTGTDNPEHVKDIILAVTVDKDNLLKISKDYSDFTNTTSGMKEAAEDDSFASEFLGGQNAFEYFVPVAENIEIAPLSAYDQGCVELIQNSFSDYLQGKVDYDKAKKNFETAIIERYPDITEIQWPE